MDSRELLTAAAGHAADFLEGLPERRVGPAETDPAALRAALGGPLSDGPEDPRAVLDALVAGADAGLMASQSPRFFGFVFGGSLPAALAADWVASAWDQNAVLYVAAPAAAVAEEVVGGWLAELLGLPQTASFAITTGCQMAHATGLGAARHHVLEQAGWDVEARGLTGAPPIRLLANGDFHVTLRRAVRLLGLGTDSIVAHRDRRRGLACGPTALRAALAAGDGPTIVCAQAGEVNSGAFDPFDAVCDVAHEHGAWVHVDGAFGLWAGAAPAHRHLVGRRRARRLVGHRRAQVAQRPLRRGLAFVAHPAAHRAAFSASAAYLPTGARDAMDWTPESSRRARAFAIWAALRSLGRDGVAELVERCCALRAALRRGARRAGGDRGPQRRRAQPGARALRRRRRGHRRRGRRGAGRGHVLDGRRRRGAGGAPCASRCRNWATTISDVDRSCAAILAAARAPLAPLRSR